MTPDPVEKAKNASARGDFAAAIQLYWAGLADPTLEPRLRVRALVSLSTAYRRLDNSSEAERAARAALDSAARIGDARTQALAKHELGTLMLSIFEDGRESAEPDPLSVAMACLDDAAKFYESTASVDFYACLLAIARILEITLDGDTRPMYARITRELVEDRWVKACIGSPQLASHINFLRGRAFFELGRCEMANGNATSADESSMQR